MKRRVDSMAAPFIGLILFAGAAQAQVSWFVGAMGTMPVGDYGKYANIGWLAAAGASLPLSGGNAIRIDGNFGINQHDSEFDGGDASTTLMGALARFIKPLGGGASGFSADRSGARPFQDGGAGSSAYLHAGGGILLHKYNPPAGIDGSTDTQVVVSLGAGMNFGRSLFGEVAYNHGLDETTYLSFGLGFKFGSQ
ncbi:MAG TPA: hypothetical protein VF981_06345 [Gemmatimonadaceae bacterium]